MRQEQNGIGRYRKKDILTMKKNHTIPGKRERRMLYLIIHASHTPPGAACNSDRLPVSPHYYVRRNGTVERPVPRNDPGRHCPWFDLNSVGICYEGGADKDGNTADTRTTLQRIAIFDLVTLFSNVFPGMKVKSVRHMTAGGTCTDPGYDVEREYGVWIEIPKYNLDQTEDRR